MVKKLEIDALFFVIVGAFFGVFLVAYVRNQPAQFQSNAETPVFANIPPANNPNNPVEQQPTLTITPTPTVTFVPTITTTSQISPDGTHTVYLKTTTNQDLSKTYEVSVSEGGPAIYTTTLQANENITLPFNAWEPQDRYFFIQENLGSGPKILVFTADGSPFGNGQPYLDMTKAFDNYGSPDTFDAATGWGGYNIIVINTKAPDGTQGTSYWYELPYGSIVPLATKF